MRVMIRADGNREIAMGHMMRCLSIADALRQTGAEVVFVTAGAETKTLIADRGYVDFILGTSYRDMEAELPVFEKFYREFYGEAGADLLLVDSYFVTKGYMDEIGRWARTVYIDDMGRPVYPVSVLINYNIYGHELPYRQWYGQGKMDLPEKCLLGCRYAPLRGEFQEGRRSRIQSRVTDVLVTTGGGDLTGAAGKLCRRLEWEKEEGLHEGVRYHIICGPFSENRKVLKKIAEGNPEFVIHENVRSMSELMEKCDIAVSAAGSTMYELCSMGLPAVCFYFADNQRQMAECFARTTEVTNAGNMAAEEEKTLDRLLAALGRLEQDEALRGRIREQMSRLTDGKGAVRIAKALMEL